MEKRRKFKPEEKARIVLEIFALDNQRIERFFRSYKWEKLYLEEYETGIQLKRISGDYVEYYNNVRPHESLDYKTPGDVYFMKPDGLEKVV